MEEIFIEIPKGFFPLRWVEYGMKQILACNTMAKSSPTQPASRIIYSSDGLLYITRDHYKTMIYIRQWKN